MRKCLIICVFIVSSLLVGCGGSPHGPLSVASTRELGREAFQLGVAHTTGKYAFTNDNFLLEGANRIRGFGAKAIFVYMTPNFRSTYPEKAGPHWPAADPSNLTELAKTEPFKRLFDMPFETFVITVYGFANGDYVDRFGWDPSAAQAEEREFHDLASHLYATYAGTGKRFILKHWEGDLIGLQGLDRGTNNIPGPKVQAMINWLKARQRGIERARQEAPPDQGVAVFHAVEVNRVLDYSDHKLTRVVNAVLPAVKADMVSYSSYDSTLQGTDAASAAARIKEALEVIDSFAPDPLTLGRRRMFISEYGLFENERPSETAWRTRTIVDTAKAEGLLGAFMWEVFDNECKYPNGQYFPIASSPGSPARPQAANCRGLWLVKPDGSTSATAAALSPYWKKAE